MAKWGLMVTTAFSVLVLAYPTGYAAMAEPSSSDTLMEGHTPREWGCAHSRADYQCGKDAAQCFYTFTVNKLGDGQNLEVNYPPSVWSATREEDRDSEKEQNYKKEYDRTFYLRLTAKSDAVTAGKTYSFTRCPENEFTLGDILPDEQVGSGGPEQKSSK